MKTDWWEIHEAAKKEREEQERKRGFIAALVGVVVVAAICFGAWRLYVDFLIIQKVLLS
jgi:hypothetical protein